MKSEYKYILQLKIRVNQNKIFREVKKESKRAFRANELRALEGGVLRKYCKRINVKAASKDK